SAPARSGCLQTEPPPPRCPSFGSPASSRSSAGPSCSSACSHVRSPLCSPARWRWPTSSSRLLWGSGPSPTTASSRRCAASSGSTSRPRARGRGAWMPSGGGKPLDRSIVEGPLARAVWMLAWPTMLQNLIGGLQGMVDHALVGHFVGYAGNAAIGVAIQIFIVVIVFLRIMFVGSIGMLLFVMVGGALRAAGDARTPLWLGVLLTVLNIACNVAFITGLGPFPRLGTAGAAVGTTVAGLVISSVAVYWLISGRLPVVWHSGMDWRPDWGIIRALFRFGLPTGFQGIAMNVAGVLLLRFIGSLAQSAEAQAAYAVGYTELFSFITWTSVGLMGAAAAVAGQNLGAGRPDRSVHGVHVAAGLGLGAAVGVPLGLCALFPARRGWRPADIWTAILLGHMTRCALSVLRFRQGKWRSIQVEMASAHS